MLFEFGPLQVDIDVDRTRKFYETARFVHETCSCDGCQNFESALANLPDTIENFFADIGIDMRKICECYVFSANPDGTLSYGGFYHVCGFLKKKNHSGMEPEENITHWNMGKSFFLAPNFKIAFCEKITMLEENFPTPVLQVEIMADLPWVLLKKNTYD